jgi:hypothetical protein
MISDPLLAISLYYNQLVSFNSDTASFLSKLFLRFMVLVLHFQQNQRHSIPRDDTIAKKKEKKKHGVAHSLHPEKNRCIFPNGICKISK